MKKASGKAQIRSNSGLLREFARPQGVFFHGRVRPHELISASVSPLVLEIRSETPGLARVAAEFLASRSGGIVSKIIPIDENAK